VRDHLSSLLLAKFNYHLTAAFRLGYGIVNASPYTEFLERGEELSYDAARMEEMVAALIVQNPQSFG